MKTEISLVTEKEITPIAELAKPIWRHHYTPIIGEKQVEYMLDKFQSVEAIRSQIQDGYQYFQVEYETRLVGYFSIQFRDNDSLFISKFYLSEVVRGKGIAKIMLAYIDDLAIKNHCETLDLTVNKNNLAYKIYLKLGFVNQGSAEFDIGEGYIMDDYLMSKAILKNKMR